MSTLIGYSYLSGFYFIIVVPIFLGVWFVTRKLIAWNNDSFLTVIPPPVIWFLLEWFFPRGKSLTNISIELTIIGLFIGGSFIMLGLFSKFLKRFPTMPMLFSGALFTVLVYFLTPVLAE